MQFVVRQLYLNKAVYKYKIYPDFEADSFYARGTIDIKGKIYIYQIIFAALRLVLDKNCRRLLKKIMN